MLFTDSPYEPFMKEIPYRREPEKSEAPKGTPCHECVYWQGVSCLGTCYKKLTSGQLVPKLGGEHEGR